MPLIIGHPDILIVDDEPDNLSLLTQILSQRGYKIRVATSGERAIESARQHQPDLVLLDIMLPGLDGFDVCSALKADEKLRDIAVIFISALDETLDKVKAFSVGGVDYISKPFQTEEVLARVKTHLALHQLQAQLVQRNQELEARNAELQQALATVKALKGILPICGWCKKKIQNTEQQWVPIDVYIEAHSEATFTHGICPECLEAWRSQTQSAGEEDGR